MNYSSLFFHFNRNIYFVKRVTVLYELTSYAHKRWMLGYNSKLILSGAKCEWKQESGTNMQLRTDVILQFSKWSNDHALSDYEKIVKMNLLFTSRYLLVIFWYLQLRIFASWLFSFLICNWSLKLKWNRRIYHCQLFPYC